MKFRLGIDFRHFDIYEIWRNSLKKPPTELYWAIVRTYRRRWKAATLIMAPVGIIFDIKKYAIHDGPGIRTTVFLKGCPLDCWWCHNPEGRLDQPETICIRTRRNETGEWIRQEKRFGLEMAVDEIMPELEKDTVFYDQSGGGVTFSGGEPLMQPEFLLEMLKACRRKQIHTAVDTCGYAPSDLYHSIYDWVDLFLFDLKILDNEQHKKYTGVSNELILDNLIGLSRRGDKIALRLPMITGITDTADNIGSIMNFIEPLSGIRDISLLPYNRLANDKMERFGRPDRLGPMPDQPESRLGDIAQSFAERGYQVKVGG
jgi:pyruvate formate lyase activating enzyme